MSNTKNELTNETSILPYPLPVAEDWQGVRPETVAMILTRHQLTAGDCARMLSMKNSRKVREWIGGTLDVPYPYWYCLLDKINRLDDQTHRSPAP